MLFYLYMNSKYKKLSSWIQRTGWLSGGMGVKKVKKYSL